MFFFEKNTQKPLRPGGIGQSRDSVVKGARSALFIRVMLQPFEPRIIP
jgi:hypothetical protein